ncbi:unnamed protein product [Caretta caretta]
MMTMTSLCTLFQLRYGIAYADSKLIIEELQKSSMDLILESTKQRGEKEELLLKHGRCLPQNGKVTTVISRYPKGMQMSPTPKWELELLASAAHIVPNANVRQFFCSNGCNGPTVNPLINVLGIEL